MTELTETEIDSLTECECGHFANEHSSDGCLATDFSEDWRPIRDDDKCSCTHSPAAINRHAVERIKAATYAAGVAREPLRSSAAAYGLPHKCSCCGRGICGDLPTLADRLAAARAEGARDMRTKIEALPDEMAVAWGGDASWLTTGNRVADLVRDWLNEALADGGEPQ